VPIRTRQTWPWKRRVIYKAEVVRAANKEPKDNPRFVVTNLKQSPQWIYQKVLLSTGDVENRIKELHDGMQIGRTSCSNFWPTPSGLMLTAARVCADAGDAPAPGQDPPRRAQVSTLRERFLKLGAQVVVSVRRIVLHLPQSFRISMAFSISPCAWALKPAESPTSSTRN